MQNNLSVLTKLETFYFPFERPINKTTQPRGDNKK